MGGSDVFVTRLAALMTRVQRHQKQGMTLQNHVYIQRPGRHMGY